MSSSSQKELVQAAISQSYPVGTIVSLTPLHYPSLHSASESEAEPFWRVETDLGLFCFKLHRRKKSCARALFEETFQSRMYQASSANGALVPKLICTMTGETFVEHQHHRWWLEELIEVQHQIWWQPELDPQICKSAGESLYRWHGVTRRWVVDGIYEVPSDNPDPSHGSAFSQNWSNVQTTAPGQTGCLNIAAMEAEADLCSKPLGQQVLIACETSILRARAILSTTQIGQNVSEIEAWSRALDECERLLRKSGNIIERLMQIRRKDQLVMVHGDYHQGNALYNDAGVGAIVDFEDVRVEHPLYDLAYGAVMFGTPWQVSLLAQPLEVPETGFAEAFIEGYRSIGDAVAISGITPYKALACILICTWLLESLVESELSNRAVLNCVLHVNRTWKRAC